MVNESNIVTNGKNSYMYVSLPVIWVVPLIKTLMSTVKALSNVEVEASQGERESLNPLVYPIAKPPSLIFSCMQTCEQ